MPGLGAKLRRRRTALGLSTTALAELCRKHGGGAIDHAKVVHIEAENGRGGMTLPTFRALCLALDASPAWLLGISTDPHLR